MAYIKSAEYKKGEKINLIGHSHGGNIIKELTQIYKGSVPLDEIILLATPVRDDYKLNNNVINEGGKVFNVYDDSDMIQRLGGFDTSGSERGKSFAGQQIDNSKTVNIEVEVSNDIGIENYLFPMPAYIYDEIYGEHINMDSKEVLEKIK